jgi:hypothetical protein
VIGTSIPGPFAGGFTSFRCDAPATFCYGAASACPCANGGLPGRGCDNAGSTGGVRLALGSFAPDGVGGGAATLATSGYPSGASPTTVLLRGTQSVASGTPLFDGLLCVQGTVARLQATSASNGSASFALTHGAGAGEFHYQAWYRSIPASFCDPVAANFSNGLTLVWP